MANHALVKNTDIHIGDTVRVYYKIIEKEDVKGKTKKEVKHEVRERIQPYEGTVISIKGVKENQSFTVRRNGVDNIGIERIFPAVSPWIDKVTVKKKGDVNRAKLYYLRLVGKKRKITVNEQTPQKQVTDLSKKHSIVKESAQPDKTK